MGGGLVLFFHDDFTLELERLFLELLRAHGEVEGDGAEESEVVGGLLLQRGQLTGTVIELIEGEAVAVKLGGKKEDKGREGEGGLGKDSAGGEMVGKSTGGTDVRESGLKGCSVFVTLAVLHKDTQTKFRVETAGQW